MQPVEFTSAFEDGVRVVNATISNLKSTLSKVGKSGDEKTISVISRMVEFLGRLAAIFSTVSGLASPSSSGVTVLAPYTYVFKVGEEVVLLRSRPEHVVVSVNSAKSEVAIKTRKGNVVVSPNSIKLRARGVSIQVDPRDVESIRSSRDELNSSLGVFEEVLYRKISLHIERLAKKR